MMKNLPKTQERSLDPLLLALFNNTHLGPRVPELMGLFLHEHLQSMYARRYTYLVSDKSFIRLHIQIKQDLLIKNQSIF